ncbi:MAG: hypothetical protein AAGD00_04345 [Planctomycetota bacterium]
MQRCVFGRGRAVMAVAIGLWCSNASADAPGFFDPIAAIDSNVDASVSDAGDFNGDGIADIASYITRPRPCSFISATATGHSRAKRL